MAKDKFRILKEYFGFSAFRSGQEEVIDAILEGRDVLAVMPTGAGKSLCYEVPALILPGMTIVISPLISLMKDQVEALRAAGVPAYCLNSSLSTAEYSQTMAAINKGEIKLLYLAPERLQKTEADGFLTGSEVPLVVIDEAHCVSQWGHDFRPGYLDIAAFIGSFDSRPVSAAFTATATPKVRENIKELLKLKKDALVTTTGFDRPNLYFEVQKPKDKKAALLACLEKRASPKGNSGTVSGIVYCTTRKAVEELYELLRHRGFPVTRYHAGLDDSERRANQDDFLYDRKTIMLATNAFGMGINKSNVSFVIHYNMPKNIESYYQEAGRAGRDGEAADCILLYSGQDVRINEYLITHSEDDEVTNPGLELHNRELLRQITFYATGNDCLRKRLLAYFGEEAPSYCGNCSVCRTEFEETDVTVEAKKIISCVFRLKQRNRSFGKTTIIDILRGSKSEKIRRFGLEDLSTWGIMAGMEVHRIRVILDHLIEEGSLVSTNDEYPVVNLGEAGEILHDEKRVLMKLPKEKPEGKSKHGEVPELPQHRKAPVNAPPLSEPPFEEALFAQLRELRKEFAAREGVPSFIVFSDASLRDMCRKRPSSRVQFSAVNGVGSVKLEKYGEAFIELIRSYPGN